MAPYEWNEIAGALGVLALVTAWIFLLAFHARRTLEFRARLLELMAKATEHGLPLPALFERAKVAHRGRRRRALERMHARLRAGATVSAACTAGGFSPDAVAPIAAAEGTGALPRALSAVAGRSAHALLARHRLLLTLIYPVLLVVVLATTIELLPQVYDSMEQPSPAFHHAAVWLERVVLSLGAAVVLWWFVLRRFLPVSRLRRAEGVLDTVATALSAGLPLAASLRRAGHGDAAVRVEAGAPLESVVAILRLPGFAARRFMLSPTADALAHAAEECGRRHRARTDRLLGWVYPVSLLLLGTVAALYFAGILQFSNVVRAEIMPW